MAEIKEELKKEIKGMKKENEAMKEDIESLKRGKQKQEETQDKTQERMKNLEILNQRVIQRQDYLERTETEYQLRLRNIHEEKEENIREKVTEILVELLQRMKEYIEDQIDRTYRINTNYARKHKTDRDVIIQLTRKVMRDEILRTGSKKSAFYKEKRIVILKEFPTSTIKNRRKYAFLTDELKRQNMKFRWEKDEGLMTTYKGQRYWVKSVERARQFYEGIKAEDMDEEKDHVSKGKQNKGKRMVSPRKEELENCNQRITRSMAARATDTQTTQEEIATNEEDEEGEEGEEETQEGQEEERQEEDPEITE
ncbi:trichohyalin-like [Anolis sagrei]|uniref:trichohyalin-like n=1 Tax=Anolis sagrei TaxID=38937 RepID=UPI003521F5A1